MALSTRSASRPAIGATRVRQGRLGRHVLLVLIATLLLVVIGFFATWTFRAGDLASVEPTPAAKQVDARRFDAPPPAGAARQNDGAGGQPDRSTS